MVNITLNDLNKMGLLKSNAYYDLYALDDEVAYKIYKSTLCVLDGERVTNPEIIHNKRRIRLMKNLSGKLELNNIILDELYLNGTFRGYVIKRYYGKTLKEVEKERFDTKMMYTRKLLKAHRELVDNGVFKTDYDDSNIFVDGKNISITDLDSISTVIKPLIRLPYYIKSNESLSSTILYFFGEFDYDLDRNIELYGDLINRRPYVQNGKLENIEDYLIEKSKPYSLVMIDKDSDLGALGTEIGKRTRIVLVNNERNNEEEIVRVLSGYRDKHIRIFDVSSDEKLPKYESNFNFKKIRRIEKDKILRLK